MFKKAVILAGLLIAVLAAACGGSSNSSDKSATSAPTSAATSAPAKAASPTAAKAAPTTQATTSGASDTSFNPFGFLTGQALDSNSLATQGAVAGDADPDLKSVLLTESDLPSGFSAAAGDMGYTLDLPDGQMKMAMRTFTQGDASAADMGPVVMSAAMTLPVAELSKYDSELGQLDQMSSSDFEQQMAGASALGVTIKDFGIQKIDIGDGGASMHMVMDMSGLAQAFGGSSDQLGAFANGIAYDAYMFKHGQFILMTMSVYPADQSPAVDIESLANKMDSRAAGGSTT